MLLIKGAKKTLQDLSTNHALFIATSGKRETITQQINQFDLQDIFVDMRCLYETRPKPNPDPILSLIAQHHLNKEETIMVGDSVNDIYCAQSAGVDSIFVQSGIGSKDVKTICNYILTDITHIPKLFIEISN